MVSKGRRVADIGCDHGYVSIYLCRRGLCSRVIAMDVRQGPLERARANIKKYGLSDYIETRLSDGTGALEPGEADALVISGMGGRLMIRILEEGFARLGKFPELVLQPQSEIFLVRAFLRQQGIKIIDETMVLDEGKYYTVIKAGGAGAERGGYRQITEDYFGPVLLVKRPRVFEEYLQKEAEKTKELLLKVTKRERIEELTQYLSLVEEAIAGGDDCRQEQVCGGRQFTAGGMGMKCEDIMGKLEELSPAHFAQDWDNVGLLVGRTDKEVHSVYLALDATDEAVEEAVRLGADMIITHHPMIFKGMKQVRADHFIGRRIIRLLQNDMCCFAMHTNFDIMGMADAAADELKLRGRQVLLKTYEDEISTEGFGRFGTLPRIMTLRECAAFVKERFGISRVRVFGDGDAEVERAAICPGSGGSMIDAALELKADVYITGDIDHHEGIDAVARGLSVIDAGHYGIEQIFVPYMKEYLKRELPGLLVYTKEPEEPFWYV